ncbi:MAG TPA: hypothetical protein VLF93_01810 [Candidatus Saccharimonadales bacterium]|nr:hypothetical protein [Candidatus Saccharimonadales bacterium]
MVEKRIDRFELSHSPTTETPPGMIKDIVKAVGKAYTVVGNTLGIAQDEIYAQCLDVSEAMIPELFAYRIKPVTVTYRFVDHGYLILSRPDSQKFIIVDGTWQGMLASSERTAEKPKILIGTSQEVVGALRSYGLTQEQTLPWTFK